MSVMLLMIINLVLTLYLKFEENIIITLRTDWSPEAASEKQELENILMLQMLLVIAGLSPVELVKYNKASNEASAAYTESLGEPEQEREHSRPTHSQQQWEAAKLAALPKLAVAEQILITAGITIENKLDISNDDQMFSEIITSVFNDYGQNKVAQIVRAVIDIESEHYVDNVSGYGLTTAS